MSDPCKRCDQVHTTIGEWLECLEKNGDPASQMFAIRYRDATELR
jgi:hypothetical protein